MKILHLVLKYEWYDMIEAGVKKEEYRDLSEYWRNRLSGKKYDAVRFQRGYTNPKTMLLECDGLSVGYGKEQWGAVPHIKYYVIKLGDFIKEKPNEQ